MGFQPVLYLLLQTNLNRHEDCTGYKPMLRGQTPRNSGFQLECRP